MTLEIRVQMC